LSLNGNKTCNTWLPLRRDSVVSIGAGNDDVEVLAVLADVGGVGGGDGATEEGALDVGLGEGVGASGGGVDGRVALEEDVEGAAAGDGAADGRAGGGVVRRQVDQTHVGAALDGGLEVGEGASVALGRGREVGECRKRRVVGEAGVGVGLSDGPVAVALGLARVGVAGLAGDELGRGGEGQASEGGEGGEGETHVCCVFVVVGVGLEEGEVVNEGIGLSCFSECESECCEEDGLMERAAMGFFYTKALQSPAAWSRSLQIVALVEGERRRKR